jgi:hypothetical protein
MSSEFFGLKLHLAIHHLGQLVALNIIQAHRYGGYIITSLFARARLVIKAI